MCTRLTEQHTLLLIDDISHIYICIHVVFTDSDLLITSSLASISCPLQQPSDGFCDTDKIFSELEINQLESAKTTLIGISAILPLYFSIVGGRDKFNKDY